MEEGPRKTIKKVNKIVRAKNSSVGKAKTKASKPAASSNKKKKNPANNFPTYRIVNTHNKQGQILNALFKKTPEYKESEGLPIQNIEANVNAFLKKNDLKGQGFRIRNLNSEAGKMFKLAFSIPAHMTSIGDYVVCASETKSKLCTDKVLESENVVRDVIRNYDEETASKELRDKARYPNSKGLISGLLRDLASPEVGVLEVVERPKQFIYE